ncbi:MAG: hypothetical protein IKW44_04360 [Bacteroidaceae bacterium]|nr:hypothetical protein [Bacteroidaceae bacterium]
MLYRKEEAEQRAKQMMRQNLTIVNDFNDLMRPKEQVRIQVIPKSYPMGWALSANLYFGDSVIKEYDFAEHAYLDLNEMVLKKMLERHNHGKEDAMSWSLTCRDGFGSECPLQDIDESAKRRVGLEIMGGHTYGSLGDEDFYAPSTAKERMPKSNLEAVRALSDEELSHIIMCPYEMSGRIVREDQCRLFSSCQKCSLDWLLQTYDEKHHWFNK